MPRWTFPDNAITGLARPQGGKVFVCIYQVHYMFRGDRELEIKGKFHLAEVGLTERKSGLQAGELQTGEHNTYFCLL